MEPPLFTRADNRGRRLFARRSRKWGALSIWAGILLSAACFGGTQLTGLDAAASVALGCASFAVVGAAVGIVIRAIAGRP